MQHLVAAMESRAVWASAGVILFLSLLHLAAAPVAGLTTDGLSLLALKSAVSDDPTGALRSWLDTDADPCAWLGVTCAGGRVTALALANRSLAGYLPSELSLLSALETLSLPRNLLSGPIPAAVAGLLSLTLLDLSHNNLSAAVPLALADLRSLAVLDLSHNLLSGAIPDAIGEMEALSRLDLSSNRFTGTLPAALAALPALSGVLNLSCNLLSGPIPYQYGRIPVAVSLDLRLNNLSGEIPPVGSLLNQGPTAFAGNPGLCGFPLRNPCFAPESGIHSPEPNPSVNPASPIPRPVESEPKRRQATAVLILAAVVLTAAASVLVLQWQFRKRRGRGAGSKGKDAVTTMAAEEWREGRSGEIYVALDEEFGLELEELLRASAYVVGKSRSGIVYKVVVARGSAVAVRRLSEAEDGEADDEWRRRRAFESEAAAIGRAKHPNVVALKAYYYAPDEKLLVYDYIPNGTLHSALHGGSLNPTAAPLAWSARLAIVQGAARGLAYLHECSPRKYIHGNVRSSKILLDDELRPYISGFGLARLVSGSHKFYHSGSKKFGSASASVQLMDARAPSSAGYIAPEARAPGCAATQKCDVYAFGVVLLEVLTGRMAVISGGEGELEGFVRGAFKEERPLSEVVDPALLGEVHAKKQVLAVFHVALGCTEPDPEARPRMRAVCESLERAVAQQ